MPAGHNESSVFSENRSWISIHSLLTQQNDAPVALVGVPLFKESLTPGRCDLAPGVVRAALKRLSVYDLETKTDLSELRVLDGGDLKVGEFDPGQALEPISSEVRELCRDRTLTILLGGDNAITRPGVHGLDETLQSVGVLTLDAHFDLRDTEGGLNNGNPMQALLEDGLPGRHISQIGLAPFANTRKAHSKALKAGISVRTLSDCNREGFIAVVVEELQRLSRLCTRIYVDFDIDVIDRAQMPGAPGARPAGISSRDFFSAARVLAAHPKVNCVDLVEFDPSADVNAIGALTAGRWLAEIFAGYSQRTV